MPRHLRVLLPAAVLVAFAATGCLLLSGQFVITYNFAEHGYEPITVNSATAVTGVQVDLKTLKAYRDHASDLKDVVDLAVVGTLTNLDATAPTNIEVWVVHNPGASTFTTDADVRAAGVRAWGPVTLAKGATRTIGWDDSAKLFTGRQELVNEVKGDGRFDLYLLGSGGYKFRISKAALIAVIAAGR